jgi:hypothetical protein
MSLRSFTRAATAATQSLSLIGRASWQRQKRPPYHGHGDGAPQRRIDRGGKPPPAAMHARHCAWGARQF